MGRPYAKLYRDIWSDSDFAAIGAEARYVYMFLFSQPDLNAAGVLPLTTRRWASRASVGVAAINEALDVLSDHKYVVMDHDTEELLVRTFIRNDGLWRIPNTLYAVVRDAARTVSPTLRATLAAELAALPVDELTGKRAADMKVQVITVVATLRATHGSTVEPWAGMRDGGAGEGVGAGESSSGGSVVNQSSERYARTNGSTDDLIDLIVKELRKATGKDVSPEWAAKTRDYILADRVTSNPAAYVLSVIRNEPNPKQRFLPLY